MSFTGVFQKAFVSSLLETKMTERKPLRSSTYCLLTSCCLDGVFTWFKASGGSAGKESTCNAGDQIFPWVGKIPLEKGMATHHSSILAWENSTDRGAWRAIVHGVAKSQTQLRHD